MTARQNPTDRQNLHQQELFRASPRERRLNIVSETVTIYGEAPSGAHEAEPRWTIWRETRDANGRIDVDYAQDGANNLYWIYNTNAFEPVPDPTGRPYAIQLDNMCVFDGMGAGLPVANITVLDVDSSTHTVEVVFDPFNKFQVSGNVLLLQDSVQLVDIAYPLRLRATDEDGKMYDEVFAIEVKDAAPVPEPDIGEINLYEETIIGVGMSAAVFTYVVPAERELRVRLLECFGKNLGSFELLIDGERQGFKETYWTRFEVTFNLENFELEEGTTVAIIGTNKGHVSGLFNARLRGYQFAT